MASVDSAPIRLNALIFKNVYASLPEMVQRVAAHYKMAVITEAYKVRSAPRWAALTLALVSWVSKGGRGRGEGKEGAA